MEVILKTASMPAANLQTRLEHLEHCLLTFPASVVLECYALTPPEQVKLAVLLSLAELQQGAVAGPVLRRFVQKLEQVRADLNEEELLELDVPVHAGDQEVYLARLGKWRFELQQLQRDSGM